MQTVTFMATKGGVGKTTLAVHTAVAALQAGERVVVVDTDPQRSAMTWADTRHQEAPTVVAVSPTRISDVIAAARHDGMTLMVIDTAPHAAPEAARVARVSDLIVLPVRPSAFDLAAAEGVVRIVNAAKARAAFVVSAAPFRAPETAEARTALERFGLPIAPVVVTDRRAFARAVTTGRAVTEFEPDGKAAGEIRDLWNWIRETIR